MVAPAGRKVVWVGEAFPPVDDAPPRLPGVVVQELPDGWNFVSWVDRGEEGWHSPDAVYETKNLQDVTDDEFERRVQEVLDSDWPGQPVEALDEVAPLPYSVGDRVRWVGPLPEDPDWDPRAVHWNRNALGGGLTSAHPGTVVEVDHRGNSLRVRWVDKNDEFEGRETVTVDSLEPISEADHASLTASLRESDWDGLPDRPR